LRTTFSRTWSVILIDLIARPILNRATTRTGYCLRPDLPRTAREAHAGLDPLFTDTRRVFFADRGVWDAISSSGPHASFAHQAPDIDTYLGVLNDFLDEMCAR
jgi:glutamate-1-semialdehyde 2,1-aminomutase